MGDGLWSSMVRNPAIASTIPQIDRPAVSQPASSVQLAQTADTGCRQTNSTTGVYEQPNLDSTSRGVLAAAQTVKLEVLGTGTGWARISQPVTGWIEARYLTPTVACDGLEAAASTTPSDNATANPAATASSAAETASNPSRRERMLAAAEARQRRRLLPAETTRTQPASSFPQPTRTQPNLQRLQPNRPINIAEATTVTCDVLPAYGLIVRSDPSLVGDTYIDTIPPGTYQFRFTRNTQTNPTPEGTRRWVYITAPVEGWISLGFVGKEFNLGGQQCG
jgi:hypothetical protein